MESRNIQLVGNRSYAITLPKEWVIRNHLKEKSAVQVTETPGSDLLISARATKTKRTKEINVSLAEIEELTGFLVFAYVKGIDHISISGKFTYEHLSEMKRILKHLEGYDITHQDGNRIDIAFLFTDVDTTVLKTVRRMLYLLDMMVPALEKQDMETLEDSENSVDRLHNLAKRILYACSGNWYLRKTNDLRDDEEIFFNTVTVKRLESVGDCIYKLKDHRVKHEQLNHISKIITLIREVIDGKTKPMHAKKDVRGLIIAGKTDGSTVFLYDRIKDLAEDIFESAMNIEFDRRYTQK